MALGLALTFNSVAPNAANAQDLSSVHRQLELIERQYSPRGRGGLGGGTDPTLDFSRTPSERQERVYGEITDILTQQQNMLDAMRAQITSVLEIEYEAALEADTMTQQDIEDEAFSYVSDYLRERLQSADEGITSLPEQFSQSVRGCSVNGEIFFFRYNIGIDYSDIGAFGSDAQTTQDTETSLLERNVRDSEGHFTGIYGMDQFMANLNDIHFTVNGSVMTLGGQLLDAFSSENMNGDLYTASLEAITQGIIDNIERKHGLSIDVTISSASQLQGRCGVALPQEQQLSEEELIRLQQQRPPSSMSPGP